MTPFCTDEASPAPDRGPAPDQLPEEAGRPDAPFFPPSRGAADVRRARLEAEFDALTARVRRESPSFGSLLAVQAALHALDRRASRRRPGGQAGPRALRLRQTDAAEAALLAAGRALSTDDLLPLVRAQGTVVGGTSPKATLASSLSQDPRFVSRKEAGRPVWVLVRPLADPA
jgi:hypothetical protein